MAAPVCISRTTKDHTAIFTYDQPLDESSPPLLSDYIIVLSATNLTTISVVVLGSAVYVGTAERMYPGLTSGQFFAGRLKNLAGELAPAWNGVQYVNSTTATDTTVPNLLAARVGNAAAYLYFDEVLDPASVPAASAFGVSGDEGAIATVDPIVVYGNRVTVPLAATVDPADLNGLIYTPPGTGNLRDYAPNNVAAIPFPIRLTSVVSDVVGYYAAQDDIEDWFGIDNVAAWSQLDNEVATADETRITRALAYADRQIDRELRTAGYTTPIATSSADFKLLTDIAAEMAGVWLYLARGKQDLGGGETGAAMAGKMEDHRKHADDELTDLIADGIDGASRFSDTSGAPLQIIGGTPGTNGLAADGLPLGWCG